MTVRFFQKRKSFSIFEPKIHSEPDHHTPAATAEVDAAHIPDDIKTLVKKMLDTTNVESLTGDEKRQYEQDLKHYRDCMGTLDYAKEERVSLKFSGDILSDCPLRMFAITCALEICSLKITMQSLFPATFQQIFRAKFVRLEVER